jgi:hypothetical protein
MKFFSLHISKRLNRNQICFLSGTGRLFFRDSVKNCKSVVSIALILLASYGLTSCQKVISIDLNSASPQLVVEANISNMPGPYFIKLSKTVSFSGITEIPADTGATVEISDSSGYKETLTELTNGFYRTRTLKGIPGHKYTLTIKTDGETYESVSKMPYPIENLSLGIKREADYGHSFGGGSGNQPMRYVVNYEINDPGEYKNYYRFVVYYKNGMNSSHRAFDDQFHNGKIIADEFELHDTLNFNPGDTVMVELQSIDGGAYNFFRTLREGAGGMSFLSASPSNPISNISNNGLGYFNVCSVTDRMLIIPEK